MFPSYQVFTIVNDESYYYPDLMRGAIVDGQMWYDVAAYTGSTTGQEAPNEGNTVDGINYTKPEPKIEQSDLLEQIGQLLQLVQFLFSLPRVC